MVMPPICILHWIASSTGAQIPVRYFRTMTEQTPLPQKRVAPETNPSINGLIAACNKNDRFKLLDDDNVLPGNLNNSIHPTLRWFNSEGPMRQMLQLASHFISHDTLLDFFVPLLYGRELTDVVGPTCKTYLSDPLANASTQKRGEYLAGVREALHCLGHSVSFQFQPPAKRVYARTMRDDARPKHATSCCPAFQRRFSCRIEMAEYFHDYYSSGEYGTASRCAQFRHDFLFAATLVHEIVHAIGVLRRGNLSEPHIRADCPETEWGYGWEHFMFGNVINPQDLTRPGTHLLMRKVWVDQKTANEAGGKEYCDVPMTYIAQWFRNETWSIIAEHGPTAIAEPIAHFKIQPSNKYEGWIVKSDHADIKQDLITLVSQWGCHSRRPSQQSDSSRPPAARSRSSKVYWIPVTTKQLQRDNVPVPLRTSAKLRPDRSHRQKLTQAISACYNPTTTLLETEQKAAATCRSPSSSGCCTSRKRPADSLDECCRVSKAMKP